MSKKVDENYFHDEREDEEEEEDKKCPPQRHEGQRNVTPKHEAAAIEEAVLFDEKKEIKGGTDGHVLASNVYQMSVSPKDRNTPHDTFRGGHMVSASRGPDYSLGAESVDIQGWHCPKAAENRRRWDQGASLPGAFQEGFHDIEEGHAEDEFTVTAEEEDEEQAPVVTRENSIKPVSADLVNEEEEGRRLQEKINQALERERQQAVVAEVVPATRRRNWFIVGALLLLVVVAIATTLGLKQGKSQEQDPYPNCAVPDKELIGNGYCDLYYDEQYNTTECEWDGYDCVPCDDGFFGPFCNITGYPNCTVPDNKWIGDGLCLSEPFNTTNCGWDGGDCLPCDDGYVGFGCTLHYPDCLVSNLEWIEEPDCMGFGTDSVTYSCFYRPSDSVGNGVCDGDPFNTEECGWDGDDCCAPGLVGPECNVTIYPNCTVLEAKRIGDGYCDGLPFNTEECGWDGGDCCAPGLVGPKCNVTIYPNCTVPIPNYIGDGACDGLPFNTEECGWDGGDCCVPGLVGPYCNITSYPNCTVPIPTFIGNGYCDYEDYNTEECGWDGGDCV